jgi:hypothetical protein
MNITEFLEARIAEDEELASAALIGMHGKHADAWDYGGYVLGAERDSTPKQDEFITAWWPQRVLAECAAKRAIIAAFDPQAPDLDPHVGVSVIAMLAAIYADHPDYQQEWGA